MCGIAGVVALSDKGRQQVSKLRQSIRTLQTRGPDDEGIYLCDDMGLAQRSFDLEIKAWRWTKVYAAN